MLVVVIKAANVSSAACCCCRSFFPHYLLLLLTTSADSVPYLVLNFYRYTTALSPKLPAPPPAPPRRRGSRCCCCCCCCCCDCCCCWCLYAVRKFLKVKNRLSVVMTSPSLSALIHTRSMAKCLCVGSMGGGELAVIMALVLSVTGHLRGRRSSAGCGGRRCSATCRANSHRLFRIAQHSCSFEYFFTYTKTAVKSHRHQKVPANCCTWPVTRRPVSVFSEKIWKYLSRLL